MRLVFSHYKHNHENMEETQKWLAATAISWIAALVLIPTVIGAVIFGLLGIGFAVKWQTAKHDERPWWTKSFVTLWRERGEDKPDQ